MSLSMSQNYTAIAPKMVASFLAVGGTAPYVYSVVPGGAGGSIVSGSGLYTAPNTMGSTPQTLYDTIQVTDALSATANLSILVGNPLFLFCEVIQKELELPNGRVWLWDQKVFQPTDSDLYVAVSEISCKPFSNNIKFNGTDATQVVNMYSLLDIDIISRGTSARDRKEEVIMALNSVYAQQQQEANSFYIGKLPPNSKFMNLSQVDGAAIPYRYKISVAIQYSKEKTKSVPYFDQFTKETNTDP